VQGDPELSLRGRCSPPSHRRGTEGSTGLRAEKEVNRRCLPSGEPGSPEPAPAYHNPDVEGDAERQVGRRQQDGPFELVEEEIDQPGLEDEGVEEHEEDDDDVEENSDVLDAAGGERERW